MFDFAEAFVVQNQHLIQLWQFEASVLHAGLPQDFCGDPRDSGIYGSHGGAMRSAER